MTLTHYCSKDPNPLSFSRGKRVVSGWRDATNAYTQCNRLVGGSSFQVEDTGVLKSYTTSLTLLQTER